LLPEDLLVLIDGWVDVVRLWQDRPALPRGSVTRHPTPPRVARDRRSAPMETPPRVPTRPEMSQYVSVVRPASIPWPREPPQHARRRRRVPVPGALGDRPDLPRRVDQHGERERHHAIAARDRGVGGPQHRK